MSQPPSLTSLGPFTITSQLASNGVLVSWQGFDQMQIPAWIVAVRTEQIPNRAAWDQFVAESQAIIGMPASRVAGLLRFGEDEGYYWAAYEWLSGSHLGQRAQQQGLPVAPVALEWGAQALDALATLQERGVCHRYLSPASLFVTEMEQVKLLHAAWGGLLLHVNGGVANPAFMSVLPFIAPEIVAGQRCDGAADVYGIGANLYYLICGLPPYWADEPLSLCDAIQTNPINFAQPAQYVPPPIIELLQEMMSRDPDDRPGNLPALADRMRHLATEAFGAAADARDDSPLDRDNQNYSANAPSFAASASAHEDPTQVMSTMPTPASAPSEAGPSSSEGVRGAIRRSSLSTGPTSAASSNLSPIPESHSGPSADDKKRYAVMAIAGLVLVGGLGFGLVSFMVSLNKKKDKDKIGIIEVQGEIARQEVIVAKGFETRSKMGKIAGYNARYQQEYGRWAKSGSDLNELGALSVELLDAWSNPMDIRGEYVVSAGEDRQWDTPDDMHIDSSTMKFGGHEPLIVIEGKNALFDEQIKAAVAAANMRLAAKYELSGMVMEMEDIERSATTGMPVEEVQPDTPTRPPENRKALFGGSESDEKP